MNQPDTPSQTEQTDEAVETTDQSVQTPAEQVDTASSAVDTAEDQTPAAQGDLSADERDHDEADKTPAPPAEESTVDLVEAAAVVEAILFATSRAISISKIQHVAELPNRGVVKDAIRTLNQRYDEMGCAFRIESIAGGFQVLTREEYDDVVSRLFKVKSDSKLSSAAMETLSIIAYRQPIMRADIEAIRGVSSGEMVRKLMEKNLVKIVGRAEVLGRPMLYGTTTFFLEAFGLSSIEDLPRVDELRPRPEPITKEQNDEDTDDAETDESEESTAPEDSKSESAKDTANTEPAADDHPEEEPPAEQADGEDSKEPSAGDEEE
ncbi:MAG: SMC-Scp complex subunit ScpB [Phycisphaerae bacterium]